MRIPGGKLCGQNPGAASSLDEVFSSLVRLRCDGSESVFWEHNFPPGIPYKMPPAENSHPFCIIIKK